MPQNITDLVVLKFDVDDSAYQQSRKISSFSLARCLIGQTSPPKFTLKYGFAGPEHCSTVLQRASCQLCASCLESDPELINPYYTDPVLASPHGHRALVDVLISYFQSQICAASSETGGHSFESIVILVTPDAGGAGADPHEFRIPPVRIDTQAHPTRPFEEPAPFCASANDLVNPVPPSLFYGSDWIAAHLPQGVSPLLTVAYYWYSLMPI
ncbi:hypothetical protein SCLCIDRAFT_33993 [Scleroderma citrinum Foug A]|uniref:Uncharacterized protein n=1 Tax=Scleroderma citrinum Foug A TaxID=1036808 RepID=A0A0C3D3V2_9AGAM|nr:hypothetical protein SCLCIDRAFT_33993 [Scleroderma citrinum Foug A]